MPVSAQMLVEECELKPGFALVEPYREPEKIGSILLPEKFRPMQAWGLVQSLGDLGYDPGFSEGDWVIFQRHHGCHMETAEGRTLVLVKVEHVQAVLE